MRHQGTCRHDGDSLTTAERKSAAIVGEESGLAARSVHRYIKLTKLLPELLELVDNKSLSLVNGVEIAGFDRKVQNGILMYIRKHGSIRSDQIAALKIKT